MHKVALTTACAFIKVVLSAASFAKVSHRRELNKQRTTSIETAREITECLLSIVFMSEFCIHIANEMRANVIAHIEFF